MKNPVYPNPDSTPVCQFLPPNPDLTMCFVPLKDGTVLELTEIQFKQIQAGAIIGGVSKEDFRPRPQNTYIQVFP